jgi:sec-independent protein translocase protein TatA
MLGNIGFPELLVILVIALLLFGTRLPAVGKSLGEGIKAFKRGLGSDSEDADEKDSKSNADSKGSSQRVIAEEARPERLDRNNVVDVEHKDVHKS